MSDSAPKKPGARVSPVAGGSSGGAAWASASVGNTVQARLSASAARNRRAPPCLFMMSSPLFARLHAVVVVEPAQAADDRRPLALLDHFVQEPSLNRLSRICAVRTLRSVSRSAALSRSSLVRSSRRSRNSAGQSKGAMNPVSSSVSTMVRRSGWGSTGPAMAVTVSMCGARSRTLATASRLMVGSAMMISCRYASEAMSAGCCSSNNAPQRGTSCCV